jgi:hypothetical protein
MNLIYATPLNGMGEDRLCWECPSNHNFIVKRYYRSLSPHPFIIFPWKLIWKAKVPPHVVLLEERQMGLTPLKRALVSGGLPMTYKVHNPRAPRRCGTRQHSPPTPELNGGPTQQPGGEPGWL